MKQLGRGAYGSVYEAVRNDYSVESKAAIKVITIPANESEVESLRADGLSENDTRSYLSGIVNDFVSEIQLMESFKGVQNIVSVEDYKVIEHTDRVGWTILIRMELLTPLNSFIGDDMLPEKAVIQLGIDMCSALEICAMRKVIHRDIKPENIFVNSFGDYKLGDFGVARKLENVAGALSQKGTYNYMAPEVEKGIAYNGTVDIYSLGLVLYRFVNRKLLPFLTPETNMSPNERMTAVRRRLDGEALPAPCDASPALAEVILQACAYQSGMRFQSAKEMKQALQKVLNGTYTSPQAVSSQPVVPEKSTEQAVVDLDRTMSVRHAPGAGAPGQVGMGTGQGPGTTQQTGTGIQQGPSGQDIYASADGLDRTMSVRHAPGAGNTNANMGANVSMNAQQGLAQPGMGMSAGINYQQYGGQKSQTASQYGNQPQSYTPNPYAGESTVYRGQVGEFGEKKAEKPMWKKVVKIILIVLAVW
ncbi:MAG: serine/threonine protein kinase [Lachnospiraceae bacterium]|nr:serine/threonine protein kinase [Lachnospiraceae bacterium]